jgi:hypothetical protein
MNWRKSMASTEPLIVIGDIETTAMKVYTWGLHKQNVLDIQPGGESRLIGMSLAEGIDGDVEWWEAGRTSDRALTGRVWDLFNRMDIFVAHNGDRFDIKKLNARFAYHGYGPPSPYQSIDTLKIWRQNFAAPGSLKYSARYLKLDEKFNNSGFQLWTAWERGEQWAIDEMREYALQDTETLRQLYLKIRPWAKTHPNMGHYNEGMACRICGSIDLIKRGTKLTNAGTYQQYQCKAEDCGAYSRSPFRLTSPTLR